MQPTAPMSVDWPFPAWQRPTLSPASPTRSSLTAHASLLSDYTGLFSPEILDRIPTTLLENMWRTFHAGAITGHGIRVGFSLHFHSVWLTVYCQQFLHTSLYTPSCAMPYCLMCWMHSGTIVKSVRLTCRVHDVSPLLFIKTTCDM